MVEGVQPQVDVVIAVHDPRRPLERAVRSVLDSESEGQARITVVCHNLGRAEVAATFPPDLARAVRWLELSDGIASAAGPFAYGIANAHADYVSIMGSDDWLEPGALTNWLATAEQHALTALVPPQHHAAGPKIRTPPVRRYRRGPHDAVKDRLAYRTAPLGVIRRDAIDRLGLRFGAGMPTGEDQLFSAKLWFSGERVRYDRRAPAYVVGSDAHQRVTFTVRRPAEELHFIDQLIADPWFRALDERSRQSIVVKLVRIHVFAVVTRWADGDGSVADRTYLQRLIARLRRCCPTFERPLPIADRRLLDALEKPAASPPMVLDLARARRRFGRPMTLLTRDPRGLLAVEGPLRFMAASALA